jgi:hypothetical protein
MDRAVKLKSVPGMEKQVQERHKLACRYARLVLEGKERMLGQKQPQTVAAAMDYVESLDMVADEKTAQKIRQKFETGVSGEPS